eukprot:TRINITY_DN9138_c0_g1_i1.p1 TRINITY_DN9138_c0_g1~~TRINITY_DN9138_c0_g1_i1.p1  ORF type:complete len:273 (+),score=27.24 TRINITY_DN9138_c0_g1_i1:1-819(+)
MKPALKYVDTHCNIPNILQKFKLTPNVTNYAKFRSESFPANCEAVLSVASDSESQQATLDLIDKDPLVWGAFGIHPLYGVQYTGSCERNIMEAMNHPKTVAWGEIGLDYHVFEKENYAKPELQKKIFIEQMKHAVACKKPVVIHTREAESDTMSMMKEHLPRDWKLHVHCFTDSLKFAKDLMEEFENLFIGFTGVITFKNTLDLQNVAKEIPLDRLLLETDGPFMAPIPFRGQTCHPGHIPKIAEKLADLKSVSVDQVYEACRRNTTRMYGI